MEGDSKPQKIEQWLYDDLVHYFKYASSAYTAVCPRPNGQALVAQISNSYTDIQGFIARDDERKEIIVSLRGSLSLTDVLMDTQIVLIPFISPGVDAPDGVLVHSGFLAAWNSVALEVLAVVAEELERLGRGYSLVAVGHSLGGAVAVLAAVALKQNFTGVPITRMYSYGAPRTGNSTFAQLVNSMMGGNAFRVVHANDGVPTCIPPSLGYHHHGIEYWQRYEPASAEHTVRCSREGEDPQCSASVPSGGINEDHMTYFGMLATTPFCW